MPPQIVSSAFFPAPIVPSDNALLTLHSNPHHLPRSAPAYIRLDGKVLTRGELVDNSAKLAWSLVHTLGLRPGDKVALVAPNSTWYPLVVHACLAAGLVIVPLNPAYTVVELGRTLHDSEAKIILTHPSHELLSTVHTALERVHHPLANKPDGVWLLSDADANPDAAVSETERARGHERDVRTLLTEHRASPISLLDPQNTPALLCYSSGTTGSPKGALLSHTNVAAMVVFMSALTDGYLSSKTMSMAVLPMQHIFALTVHALHHFYHGVPCVVLERFTPELFCAAIQRFGIRWTAVAPPILLMLAKSPIVDKFTLTSLRGILSGAAPLSEHLIEAVESRLPHLAIANGYGLTEASPVVCMDDPQVSKAHGNRGCANRLVPGLEVRLVNEKGQDVGLTEGQGPNGSTHSGEIWLRGPTIFRGYFKDEEANRNSFTPDGWYRTGDLGSFRQGRLTVEERLKQILKVGGRQVAPSELEAILVSHPKVADAAVVPLRVEEKADEYPLAYIVLRPSTDKVEGVAKKEKEHETTTTSSSSSSSKDQAVALVVAEEVRAYLDAQVAFYKRLRGGVRVIEAIPRSPSGKILHRVLRDQLIAEQAQAQAQQWHPSLAAHSFPPPKPDPVGPSLPVGESLGESIGLRCVAACAPVSL